MSTLFKNIFRFAFLIFIQVYILDNIHLHYLITPYLYLLFILWLPFQMGRVMQMLLAFALGFTLDSFNHCPGIHASACVLIAYLRPFLINLLIPQEGAENNYDEPSIKSLGGPLAYFVYAGLLTFIHHSWLFFIEACQFGGFWYFIIRTILSTAVTLFLIMVTEMLLNRKQKFRTNTM